jgi:acetolactate synthase-1/2/3 large subunit
MAETATDTLARKDKSGKVISGGHLVAKGLKNEGVDTIFTLCGGHIIDIYDGCLDEGIRIIDVRHEQVAAHAADGYARQTGKLGCVVTTAGPGCTNAITGIATAFRSESPVLHIGGQGALTQHKMGSLQDLPHVDIMAPITKFAAGVRSTERVADMVSMAARECFAGAYGPSYLEIPRDILDREVPVEKAVIPVAGRYRASTKPIGDPADIETLADLLVKADKPAILYGSQVWMARGHEEAIELVRKLNIPAYMNGAARGLLAPGDPNYFNRTRRYAFDNADVIVIVGTPFDFRMGYGKRISDKATLVQIDMDYKTVGKNRDISLGLVGDPGAILKAVLDATTGRSEDGAKKRAGWLDELRAAEQKAGQADAAVPLRGRADPPLPRGLGDQRVPDRRHDLHRRRRRRGDDLRPGGAAAPARQLDGPGRARQPRRGHGIRHGVQAGASAKGGALLLRRRRLRHDRLRHGDGQPLRRALHRRDRQQLGHEPDPLRPDLQVR